MSKAAVCLITLFCVASLTADTGSGKNVGNVPTEKNIPSAIADKFEKRVGHQKFSDWKKKYSKTYKGTQSEAAAENNFNANDKRIQSFNSQQNKSYTQGHNNFSDSSFDAFKKRKTGIKLPKFNVKATKFNAFKSSAVQDSVNFTRYMQPVQDQLDCGSCYAFTVTAVVEYELAIIGRSRSLSAQNIIDCDVHSYGCSGGWPTKALQYVRDFGITTERRYPYANGNQNCSRSNSMNFFNISNVCENYLGGNEDALKELVSQKPVVVAFHVTVNFMYYKSGIFSDPTCSNQIDHALVVVGYGTDSNLGKDYWIVRNAWSRVWGMNGYGLVERNNGNMCGIALFAMYVC